MDQDWTWLGRSLSNYKVQQRKVAQSKGVLDSLLASQSLTEARRIVYGAKVKTYSCCRDVCHQCRGKR